jgi:catechol 2,3-dioxygenase-like lactoylglutathione lyase family enzyme
VSIPTEVGAITLFIEDVARSKEFYSRVFRLEPVYEDDDAVAFRLENTTLNLLRRPAAHELVEPSEVAAADSGASFQLTIGVPDADETCRALAERGVELLNGPQDRPWGVRTAAFTDPDGHVWEIASNLPEA